MCLCLAEGDHGTESLARVSTRYRYAFFIAQFLTGGKHVGSLDGGSHSGDFVYHFAGLFGHRSGGSGVCVAVVVIGFNSARQ